jgi:hypothetical protein
MGLVMIGHQAKRCEAAKENAESYATRLNTE